MTHDRFKHFTGKSNAHANVAKSPARAMRYTVYLQGVTLKDGSRALRYVPVFQPATDEQRAVIEKARFRVADA
jgi:hypothetical protein